MKIIIIILALLFSGCALGAATSGYALKSQTADELASPARQSIIQEIKNWVSDNFQKK